MNEKQLRRQIAKQKPMIKIREEGAYNVWATPISWATHVQNFFRRLYYRIRKEPYYRYRFVVYTPKNWDGYIRQIKRIDKVEGIQ